MTFVVVIRRDDDTVEDHRNMELAKLPLVPIFASATTLSRKRETASARLRTKPCLSIVDQRSAEFQLHLPLVNSSLIDRGFLPGVRQFFARESSLSLSFSLSLSLASSFSTYTYYEVLEFLPDCLHDRLARNCGAAVNKRIQSG